MTSKGCKTLTCGNCADHPELMAKVLMHWMETDWNMNKIGELLGVSTSKVWNVLKAHNAPPRKRGPKPGSTQRRGV